MAVQDETRRDRETDKQDASLRGKAVIERQVVKCYLERHLAHKDGSKDVVGDGEKDSLLDGQDIERVRKNRNGPIRSSKNLTYCTF